MSELQEIYREYLDSTAACEEAEAQLCSATERRRESIKRMATLMAGKTQQELDQVWNAELQKPTEAYFRGFKNAHERVPGRTVRWEVNTTNRRSWWIGRMMSKSSHLLGGQTPNQYISKLSQVANRLPNMAPHMDKDQLTKVGKITLQIVNTLSEHRELLKNGERCRWCKTGYVKLPSGHCSEKCRREEKSHDDHETPGTSNAFPNLIPEELANKEKP